MNRQKWIILAVTLVLIGSTATLLAHIKSIQILGRPGVKTQPLAGSQNLEVLLPDNVPGFRSEKRDIDKIVINSLPKDTSFGQRLYSATNGFWAQTTVVLMGSDRTSIHKPQFCLTGQGWNIDTTTTETIPIEGLQSYDLPVIKLMTTRSVNNVILRGIYVYWFVADNQTSADVVGLKRMGGSAWRLLSTGVFPRWAYVAYFTACVPGQEDVVYAEMKKLIAASVPDFQLAGFAERHSRP